MDAADRTRRAVDAELARLEREHGGFEVVEKRWAVSERWHERTLRRAAAGALGGAGAWLVGDDGEVLLVRREGERRWEEPGGTHEPGESLEETARREVREEAGVDCELSGVAQAHRITVACEDDSDRPALDQLFVIFRGRPAGGEPRPREGEIAAVEWWDDHPDELHYDELARLAIPAAETG